MSDEFVILINLLKVKPEKRDALIALEAEHRHGDPHAARVKDDPADRGEGRRRPQASAFHAERPRFVLENSRRRDFLDRQTLWGTEPSRTFAGFGWRLETNAAHTPTRRGDRKAHQPRFAPELRRIGGGA